MATVSAIEKYELDPSKDDFHVADLAIRSGAFGDAVKAVKVLNVPPDQIDKAAEVLKAAGINCMVTVGYNIDADEYKVLAGSTPSTDEMRAAIVALGKCITSKTSTRISYEMKK